MDAAKTTFYLSSDLRTALKALAAQRRKTVKALLEEGTELVLERYQKRADREELTRRAHAARERLRGGLFSGRAVDVDPDALIYSAHGERRRAPRR